MVDTSSPVIALAAELDRVDDPLNVILQAASLAGITQATLALHLECSRQNVAWWVERGSIPAGRINAVKQLAWIILYALHTGRLKAKNNLRRIDITLATIAAEILHAKLNIKKVLLT